MVLVRGVKSRKSIRFLFLHSFLLDFQRKSRKKGLCAAATDNLISCLL